MTKHIVMWALLGASLLSLPVPTYAQTQSNSSEWDCSTDNPNPPPPGRHDRREFRDSAQVVRCTLDRTTGICVVEEPVAPTTWTYRVNVYTRGSRGPDGWGRVDVIINRDGTIVPELRWWTEETRELHGDVPEQERPARIRALIDTFCSGGRNLAESRIAAVQTARAFSERVQHAEGSTSATEASRP